MSSTDDPQNPVLMDGATPPQRSSPGAEGSRRHKHVARVDPPKPIDLRENREENFRLFQSQWNNYAVLSRLSDEPEEYRVALLLYTIGRECEKIVETERLQNPKVDDIFRVLKNHCVRDPNVIYERFKFNSCSQAEGEDIDTYAAKLKQYAAKCNFGDIRDELIRDRIILGISNPDTRKKLLSRSLLTLDETVQICRAEEAAQHTLRNIQQQADVVHSVDKRKFGRNQGISQKFRAAESKLCQYCGQSHAQDKKACPAFGKECRACKKKNHFASMCRSTLKNTHEIEEDSDSIQSIELIEYANINSVTTAKVFACLDIVSAKHTVSFHVDTGSAVNVIPSKYLPSDAVVQPTTTVLKSWSGNLIQPSGECRLVVRNPRNAKRYRVKFLVVDADLTPILGLRASEAMKLISVNQSNIQEQTAEVHSLNLETKEDVIAAYPQVFSKGIGSLPGIQHLRSDPSVKPHINAERRVPHAIEDQLIADLKTMEKDGVIKKVEEPTPWESSLVVNTKPTGKLRICIDPKHLNMALERERYPMKTIEEVLPKVRDSKVFSVVDLKSGYWHVRLDEESSLLTTFNSPKGRYRWLRLPFGLNVSAEIFQRRLDHALEGLEGVMNVADDVFIIGQGSTYQDAVKHHDQNLRALLSRCTDYGIKLNEQKLQLRKTSLKFLGHLVTAEGLRPDPEKVRTVEDTPTPKDASELRRYLGFLQYLAKFLPRLAEVAVPLYDLTKKDVDWQWEQRQQDAFDATKKLTTAEPVLRYFDPNTDLEIQCDASDKGLGATLMQEGQPIAYASRRLTTTEQRYAPIEKEMLAIVWSMEKYHQHTYGNFTTVYSDHRPLESIMHKALKDVPKRLQNMRIRLQHYNMKVVYKPGADQVVADYLSRMEHQVEEVHTIDHATIDEVSSHMLVGEHWRSKLVEHTSTDPTLQAIKKQVLVGWPEQRHELPEELRTFHTFHEELAFTDGLIFRGDRVVVPRSLRMDMMKEVHCAHMGVQACLRRARECVYWPRMSAELTDFVQQCDICQKYNSAQTHEPLQPLDIPERPWQTVSCDIFHWKDMDYLITVDHLSNFFEVDKLQNLSSSQVIRKLRVHFARYGQPDVLISDNGPQFTSSEFGKFADEWDVEHRTSSPNHQQANGRAEAAVKIAKTLMSKADDDHQDPYRALLAHRNTTQEGLHSSPAQRFLGRRTRTGLPTSGHLLLPNRPRDHDRQKLQQRQDQVRERFDRQSKPLSPLAEGDHVRVKPTSMKSKIWVKGAVTQRLDDRSYLVRTENSLIRRNRIDLRQVPQAPEPQCQGQPMPSTAEQSEEPHTTDEQSAAQPDLPSTAAPGTNSPKRLDPRQGNRARRRPVYHKDYDVSYHC